LGDYELVINPFKTRIFELPEPVTPPWTHEISRFPIRSDTSLQALNDVIGLFSHAAEAARRHPGALKYALLRSRSVRVDGRMWRTFQNLVWSAVSSEPTTMATALDLLAEKSQDAAVDVDRDGAADLIESLIATHAPLRNGSEVVWAVWAAIRLGVTLSVDAAGLVTQMDDNFVALSALHASSIGVLPAGAVDTARWEVQIDYDEVLTGPNWLLAYESAHQGWLEAASARVEKDEFFSVLADADVAFYDTNPSLTPFSGSAGPLPGATLPDDYG
jgi:hypothetical protein